MGLEDYRVTLKPLPRKQHFPDEAGTSARGVIPAAGSSRATTVQIAEAMAKMGFIQLPPMSQLGPAKLATPSATEIRLAARLELNEVYAGAPRNEYIVEALIRGRTDAKTGATLFETISVRFAVCQPEGAAGHFLKLVKRMCETLSLAVVQDDKTYSPEAFWAFRLRANEQIRQQQQIWSGIFEDDTERLPIAVDETWSHFLKRHPSLTFSAESTMAPRKVTADADADVDMEATLPPSIARAIAERRRSR